MDSQSINRWLVRLATLGAGLVAVMIVTTLIYRGDQDFFQSARPVANYASYVATPGVAFGLRLQLGLDNLFLIVYSAFFAFLTVRLRDVLPTAALAIALVAMLVTTTLDMLENNHILAMLHSIQHGLPVSVEEGQLQMLASRVKFHASYLSIFLFAIGVWRLGDRFRLLGLGLFAYVPLGIIISAVPVEAAPLLVMARTVFFAVGFVLAAILFSGSRSLATKP